MRNKKARETADSDRFHFREKKKSKVKAGNEQRWKIKNT